MNNSPSVQEPEFSPEKLIDKSLDRSVDSEVTIRSETTASEVQDSTSIALLEERLRVSYQRRKIGEVVIHKKIETRIVEVPVRYEKLIIQQISPEPKQLAEVDLAGDLDLDSASLNASLVELKGGAIVQGEFTSPRFASQVLYELGKTLPHQCKRVSIEIELEDPSLTKAYQERLNQLIAALQR
ncbi:MAG TPA: DUF2382 domain-containing protein [Thermosynechococcaceae cyanobacterium]